jgi:hypothetical protein
LLNIDPLGLDVTVGYFPGGPGHVGIGVNANSTSGLYPLEKTVGLFFCNDVRGAVLSDRRTQDAQSKKHAQYLVIPTTRAQDAQIQRYVDTARNNSDQKYNLCTNQCSTFVRNALQSAGVPIVGEAATDRNPQSFFNSLQQTYGH